jgi:hypothetical protein
MTVECAFVCAGESEDAGYRRTCREGAVRVFIGLCANHHNTVCRLVTKGPARLPKYQYREHRSCTTQHDTKSHTRTMAKARTSLRQAEHINIHEDDMKDEEAEETLDESMDPLEESGHTVDSSDEEEVEDSVQEDMARFEESFAGINKRFRLINRIGEGMSQIIGLQHAG